MRTLTREFYIPKGATRVTSKEINADFYLYQSGDKPAAMAFIGKAQKPRWHYRFASDEKREQRINKTIESEIATKAFKANTRKKRNEAPRGLEVGDVLRASWGYDQTNINYFEVTKLIGKRMVEIREISCVSVGTEWCQGKSSPAIGSYISGPMRRRATNGGVKVDSVMWASKMEPVSNVGGIKTFESSHWTSYA
tara:strand:+ start:1109 stop:1693 length:585 start_codon:yes stop_codon:yes gene_type:complete